MLALAQTNPAENGEPGFEFQRLHGMGEALYEEVVGEGMIRTPGVAGRVFGALGRKGINVIAIAQGSSEVSISLVVDAADAEAAVQALHELIVNGEA